MAWTEKLDDLARTARDKAADLGGRARAEAIKLREEEKINGLCRRAGKIAYENFEKTGQCGDGLREIFEEIRRHKETIAALDADDPNVTSVCTRPVRTPADPQKSVGDARVCPSCGAACAPESVFCPECGAALEENGALTKKD